VTDDQRSTSEFAVLGLLAYSEGERSGYDLWRLADRSVGLIWAPARSKIYKVLTRLAALGLTSARTVEQAERPDKQLHRLTPQGRRALEGWLGEVAPDDEPEIYLLKIFFGRYAPVGATEAAAEAYRARFAADYDRYRELERTISHSARNRFPRRVLELGLRRAQAAIEWADELRTEVERDGGAVESA
jgi:PadR family transcriptional regulator, regulatory protein AphA